MLTMLSAAERDEHRGAGKAYGRTGGGHSPPDRFGDLRAVGELLAVAVQDEQRIVDPDGKADHRGQDRGGARLVDDRRERQERQVGQRHPGQCREQRQDPGEHRAERDQQHEERDEQADHFGVARGVGLGNLTAEVHRDSGGLGWSARIEQRRLGPSGHVGDRHRIGNDGVGDSPALRHCVLVRARDRAFRVGIGHPDDLRELPQLGQRGLHGLAIRHIVERPRGRDGEDDLGLGAPRAGELLVQQVECLLGLRPGNVERVGGRLFHGGRHDREHGDHNEPPGQDEAAVPEAPAPDAKQPRAHTPSRLTARPATEPNRSEVCRTRSRPHSLSC